MREYNADRNYFQIANNTMMAGDQDAVGIRFIKNDSGESVYVVSWDDIQEAYKSADSLARVEWSYTHQRYLLINSES